MIRKCILGFMCSLVVCVAGVCNAAISPDALPVSNVREVGLHSYVKVYGVIDNIYVGDDYIISLLKDDQASDKYIKVVGFFRNNKSAMGNCKSMFYASQKEGRIVELHGKTDIYKDEFEIVFSSVNF